jgi:serine protease
VVAAAGNDGANNDTVGSYPCNYSNANIISVAASDENDKLTFYSNYGQKVHIAAPGGTPEKPIMSSYKKNPKDSQIVGLMGTSMASPLVAGVAAQVWSANPQLTAVQVKALLMETGKPAPAIGNKIRSGKVIDASAALDKVQQTGLGSSSTL